MIIWNVDKEKRMVVIEDKEIKYGETINKISLPFETVFRMAADAGEVKDSRFVISEHKVHQPEKICSECHHEMKLDKEGFYSGENGTDLGKWTPPEYICPHCGYRDFGV